MKVKTCILLVLLLAFSPQALAVKGDIEAAQQAWVMLEQGAFLIDVRSSAEFETGHIEGAVNIPHGETDELARQIGADKSRKVVLYCGSGRRAGLAIQALEEKGYSEIFNATAYEALDATRPKP